MASRFRASFLAIICALVALTAAALGILAQPDPVLPDGIIRTPDVPPVPQLTARRLHRLERTIPGNEGEFGPGGYEEERFAMRAYPDEGIPVERLAAAREAFAAIRARGVGGGKKTPGQWSLLGPTSAVYQSTRFRFSYVPREYEAAGRVTAMAIASTCRPNDCRIWVAAAGGGVWRTDNALAGSPHWTYLTASIGINAVGSIQLDPHDDDIVWVGTGEANASGDSAAGVGLYKSTDGGDTWTGPLGATSFNARAIGSIAIDPRDSNVIYAATTSAVRGVASTGGGQATPGAPPRGLYKSTDGGATFTLIHNGTATAIPLCNVSALPANSQCSLRGVRRVVLDPTNPDIVYAGSYGRGVWRSSDAGATWTQIKPSLLAADANMRPEIAVTTLPNGNTRMYVGEGSSGGSVVLQPGNVVFPLYSRLYRSDDVRTGVPVFVDLTSPSQANPGFGSFDYCSGQCWYDNLVYTPPGYPDIVYLGGSYRYDEPARDSHGRSVVLSTDAGVSWTDMTKDATGGFYPNGLHPDQHALVVHPENPFQFFSGSDGGVMRSNGTFEDESHQCDWRPLDAVRMARCRQLLSRVPSRLHAINRGMATLQFQSLSFDPTNPHHVMGGTQDNGTFETSGSPTLWRQTFWGDGGQSGFDVAINNFRFHTFFAATPEVNFDSGAIHDWNWIADRIFGIEPQLFYIPIISDPVQSGWMWAGASHVWRTKTHGRGALSVQELRDRCNEFRGDFTIYCGDWEPLGAQGYNPPPAPPPPPAPYVPPPAPAAATRLTGPAFGPDRLGGAVCTVERGYDSSTLWAATSAGRVFVSENADAEPYNTVVFNRIDSTAANDPNRFVSGIFVDPANPNRAWISYSGFNVATPATPGHVFEVVYNPATNTAIWTRLDVAPFPDWPADLPLNDVVYDSATGDLYAASDFGVIRLAAGSAVWTMAGTGMPNVEVSHLTIATSVRKLYAATHGLGAWSLGLP